MSVRTDPEIGRGSDPADEEPISLMWPTCAMHDLTLLGIFEPSSDDLPDFFVITGAAAMGRPRRMSPSHAARSVEDSPITSIAAP